MTRIYVGNLSRQITDAQLHELALPFGKPDAANIARQLRGGASKGFGFIDYAVAAQARAAIAGLTGKKVNGTGAERVRSDCVEASSVVQVVAARRFDRVVELPVRQRKLRALTSWQPPCSCSQT